MRRLSNGTLRTGCTVGGHKPKRGVRGEWWQRVRSGGKKETRAGAGIYAAQRASHDERKRRRCKEMPRIETDT